MTQKPNSSLERLVEEARNDFDFSWIEAFIRAAYTTGYNAGLADERKARELEGVMKDV